jgi:ATP adenylyltransferase
MSAMADSLQAPWRMDYIRGLQQENQSQKSSAPPSCFFCDAVIATTRDDLKRRGVLWTTDQSIVMLNLFPYTNGHLLIAPKRHVGEIDTLTNEESRDLMQQTIEAIALLKRAISPQGFNVGMNLGRCAGAGVPGHLHQHVVPRWAGDTNFMTVVAEVRVVPQAMSQLWEELMKVKHEILSTKCETNSKAPNPKV